MKRTWRNKLSEWWHAKKLATEIRIAKAGIRRGAPLRDLAEAAPTLTYEELVGLKDEMWANGWENQ